MVQTSARLAEALKRVGKTFAAVKTSVQFTELKSARSRRTIALPAVAVTALRAHCVRQLEARLAAGRRWRDQGLVLKTAIGTPFEPRNVTRQFKALRMAGAPESQVHSLQPVLSPYPPAAVRAVKGEACAPTPRTGRDP